MTTIKVAVGSKNRAKLEAARCGFSKGFRIEEGLSSLELEGFDVISEVPDQPIGDEQTKQGAINRAHNAYQAYVAKNGIAPSYSIGLEGGISTKDEVKSIECFAWMVIYNGTTLGISRTATFFLPEAIAILVRGGMELGDADDAVFQRLNSKEGNGTVGHLTRGVIERSDYYSHAIVLALIPFQFPELYTVK